MPKEIHPYIPTVLKFQSMGFRITNKSEKTTSLQKNDISICIKDYPTQNCCLVELLDARRVIYSSSNIHKTFLNWNIIGTLYMPYKELMKTLLISLYVKKHTYRELILELIENYTVHILDYPEEDSTFEKNVPVDTAYSDSCYADISIKDSYLSIYGYNSQEILLEILRGVAPPSVYDVLRMDKTIKVLLE